MMEERYHVTTQNRFYPGMSNVNKNITVEAKFISPPTYIAEFLQRGLSVLSECRLPCPSLCADVTDVEHLPQSGRRLRCSHSNVAEVEVCSNVPEKKLYFATTCVGILMHNFLTAIAQWGDGVVSCLCCRSGVAEGVSASRANRTRTSRRNVLPVILMALTVGT